jgi:hypothetical protein
MKYYALAFFFLFACALSTRPGIKVAIRNEQLNELRTALIPMAMDEIGSLDIDDIHHKEKAYEVSVTQIKVQIEEIPARNVEIKFINNTSDIELTVKNVDILGTADVRAKALFIKSHATAHLSVNDASCSTTLRLSTTSGKLTALSTNFALSLSKNNVQVSLKGGLLEKILNILIDIAKNHFFSKLTSEIESKVPSAITRALSKILSTLPTTLPLGSDLEVTYSIPTPPKMINDFLCLGIAGYVYPLHNKTKPLYEPAVDMVDYDMENKKNVQFFISEYTLETAVHALYEAGLMFIEYETQMFWNKHAMRCEISEVPRIDLDYSFIAWAPVKCSMVVFQDWFGESMAFDFRGDLEFVVEEFVKKAALFFDIKSFRLNSFFVTIPWVNWEIDFSFWKFLGNWMFKNVIMAVNHFLGKDGIQLPRFDGADYTYTAQKAMHKYFEITTTPTFDFSSL